MPKPARSTGTMIGRGEAVAAVARYLSPGDDPVRFLISIMAEAGLDVGEDPDWYGGSEEDEP
jgi:hypothetical protein